MASGVKITFVILVVVNAAFRAVDSANILAFSSTPVRSHYIINEAYYKGLAAAGHNVTVITAFPTAKSKLLPSNYHELPLILDESDRLQMDTTTKQFLKGQEKGIDSTFTNMNELIRMFGRRSHASLQSDVVQQLMKSGQKFDLFVLGWAFNDFQIGLAGHFQCPSVVISSVPPIKSLRDFVANPSGVPVIALMEKATKGVPTFYQRTVSVVWFVLEFVFTEYLDYFVNAPYYEMNFPAAQNYPSFDEVKRNVSLVLVADHFSQGNVRANMPNIREISGIQTKTVPNPLPKNLKTFLDGAKDGAILFSLGTNVKSSDFSEEKLQALFEVFGKLKQRVLWKWDGASVPAKKTDNVLMTNWLPQNDILAHPNTRLFISHCGLGGVTEAKFHGVPILAIPVFGDQPKNAKEIINEGWAQGLPYSNLNATSLSAAINELFTNDSYARKAKELSQLYRDRPQTPLQEAVFWTEYVLRHNGARHMQSPAVHLNFIQRISLDVLAVFVVILYALLKVLKWVVVKIFACCVGVIKKKKETNKLKKN